MVSFFKYRVIFSKSPFQKIKKSLIKAQNKYEIGGILLGYKILNFYFIIDVTIPKNINKKSMVSFVLDGEEHSKLASEIIKSYLYKPSVLGIWHSHICSGTTFSTQDKISNKEMACFLNGTLSMLVTMNNGKFFKKVYYIYPSGKHILCKTYKNLGNKKSLQITKTN